MDKIKNFDEQLDAQMKDRIKQILEGSSKQDLTSTLDESYLQEKIEKFLNIIPTIKYEGNGKYTSKIVEMAGGALDNDKITKEKIEKIFGNVDKKTEEALRGIRTNKWTRNREKNVNFAIEKGTIKSDEIFSGEEQVVQGEGNERARQNSIIAYLKAIPYEVYITLFNKIEGLGATEKDIEELIYDIMDQNSNQKLQILIDDIGISDIKKLIALRLTDDNEAKNKLFSQEYKAEDLKKNADLLKAQKDDIVTAVRTLYAK